MKEKAEDEDENEDEDEGCRRDCAPPPTTVFLEQSNMSFRHTRKK